MRRGVFFLVDIEKRVNNLNGLFLKIWLNTCQNIKNPIVTSKEIPETFDLNFVKSEENNIKSETLKKKKKM